MHDNDPWKNQLGPLQPIPEPKPAHPFLTVAAAWLVVFSAVLVALWIWF